MGDQITIGEETMSHRNPTRPASLAMGLRPKPPAFGRARSAREHLTSVAHQNGITFNLFGALGGREAAEGRGSAKPRGALPRPTWAI